MIQAVFLDFDHTLFSHSTMGIPESAKAALRTLQSRGIRCVLATGRSLHELRRFPEIFTLDLDGFITIDGQIVLDGDLSTIKASPFEGRCLEELLAIFNEKRLQTILVEEDIMYSNFNDEETYNAIKAEMINRHPVAQYSGNPVFLGVMYISQDMEAELQKKLPSCNFLRWGKSGIDITPAGRDKVSGIIEYLDHYGIPHSDWMAFGDSYNDIAMIKAAPIGVAMGNSIDQLKQLADYVTTDIDDNGVLNALAHYGLV